MKNVKWMRNELWEQFQDKIPFDEAMSKNTEKEL